MQKLIFFLISSDSIRCNSKFLYFFQNIRLYGYKGGISMSDSVSDTYVGVKCKVKWFNQFKGYGFVEMEKIPGDVFLHFSVLDAAGIKKLNNGDIVVCDVEESDGKRKVTEICELLQESKYTISNKKPERVTAVMKWFNPAKGFGFARIDSGEDVFIHSTLLKKHKMESIEHGQTVELLVRYTNFGYEALELFSID